MMAIDKKLSEFEDLVRRKGFSVSTEQFLDGERVFVKKSLVTIYFARDKFNETPNDYVVRFVEEEYDKMK